MQNIFSILFYNFWEIAVHDFRFQSRGNMPLRYVTALRNLVLKIRPSRFNIIAKIL